MKMKTQNKNDGQEQQLGKKWTKEADKVNVFQKTWKTGDQERWAPV